MLADWISDVFSHPGLGGALLVAAKTLVVYLFLILGLRLLGKRELGQMNVYDLVLVIVLANAVQNAMVGNDNTLVSGLVSAIVLLAANRLFTLLVFRSRKLEEYLVGHPVVIAHHGHLLEEPMRREGVTQDQVLAALREHGLHRLDQARMCVLEVDGTISVVPQDATVYRTRHHFKALRTQ